MNYTLSKPYKYREWSVSVYGAAETRVFFATNTKLQLSVFSNYHDSWFIENHSQENLFELPDEVRDLHAALDHAELLFGWTDKE